MSKRFPYYLDTETVGFYGVLVLIQYALGNDVVRLHNVWKRPVGESLDLIEIFMNHPGGIVGFNLTFDHFHLVKIFTILKQIEAKYGRDFIPETLLKSDEGIMELLHMEKDGRDYPDTLKPANVLDLMLHIQKGPYQKCMERAPIRIRRVPERLAYDLAEQLQYRLPFEPILFERRADKEAPVWKVYPEKNKAGKLIPHFCEVRCSFMPSLGLKAVAKDLKVKTNPNKYPEGDLTYAAELGFAPYALALMEYEDERKATIQSYFTRKKKSYGDMLDRKYAGTWPTVIKQHIAYWENDPGGITYATDDVVLTRGVHKALGSPPVEADDDSVLACCVASCRWRGYKVDLEGIKVLRRDALVKSQALRDEKGPMKDRPAGCLAYLKEVANDIQKKKMPNKTNKITLEKYKRAGGPVGERAEEILEARKAGKEVELYDKILVADRFHASFKIIGALSSRMSGADGLNPQGIKKAKYVRNKFPLAWDDMVLCGGDFDAFEVGIFEAVCKDEGLRKDLESGKKIHGIFGTFVYPEMTYDQILASEGTSDDKYVRSKAALFAMFYGGTSYTLMTRLGVTEEVAKAALQQFLDHYPGVKAEFNAIAEKYSPLKQLVEGGAFTFGQYVDRVESLYGFTRLFELEFRACYGLFDFTQNIPQEWFRIEQDCVRTVVDGLPRVQTVAGATMSAVFGAAMNIQGQITRQATNHRIQSTGAQITKRLQRNLWDIQPAGVHKWLVQPMNIHDEIMCPAVRGKIEETEAVTARTIEAVRPVVPLVGMTWEIGMKSWAEK